MGQTIKGLLALSVSTIAVHAMYIIVIRPKAMMMEALAAQGQPELTRSIWIILKDFEHEVAKAFRSASGGIDNSFKCLIVYPSQRGYTHRLVRGVMI